MSYEDVCLSINLIGISLSVMLFDQMNTVLVNQITRLSVFLMETLNLMWRNIVSLTLGPISFKQFYSENKDSGVQQWECFCMLFVFVSGFHSKKNTCFVWLVICFYSHRHFCKHKLKFCPSQGVSEYLLSAAEYFELWLILWHLSFMQVQLIAS